jgi:uncharacterized protein (TIGR03546 family)
MIWLKIIGKLIKTLKDGATPAQIALGIVLGWAIGLIPGWPLQVWLLVLALLLLQANIGMAFVGTAVAAALAWIFDPVLDALGGAVLTAGPLQGLFTALYNSPPWGLTRFNNTAVMGATLFALVTAPALFPLLARGVVSYRVRVLPRLARLPIMKALLGTRVVGWYRRLDQLGLL